METMTAQDVWEYTEDVPRGVEHVRDLWHWSTNYDAGKGPFTLFLDLIGYTQEEYGETFYDLAEPNLGYVELSYLSKALDEYTTNPTHVREWIEGLLGFDEA